MQLYIAGDGPEKQALESQAYKLDIAHNTHFIGGITQQKLASLFKKSAYAVFPFTITDNGDQEGFGLVVVEAMGCGCAIIASPTPATTDILKNDHNSLLVEQRSPEQLSTAMLQLISDEKLRCRLATAGRAEIIKLFDWCPIAGKYNSLLQSLVINDQHKPYDAAQ